MKERWKTVDGWPYEVSDQGRIRRGDRTLKLENTRRGYVRAELRKNGVRKRRMVHHLVLEAFRGPCPPGHQCNHKNADKQDNRVANLEWVTPSENIRHRVRLGLHNIPKGESVHNSQLNDVAVLVIRFLSERGVSQKRIARAYGLPRGTIGNVVLGRAWSHVDSEAYSRALTASEGGE